MKVATSSAWPLNGRKTRGSPLMRINLHHAPPPGSFSQHQAWHGSALSHPLHQKWGGKRAGEEGGRPRAPRVTSARWSNLDQPQWPRHYFHTDETHALDCSAQPMLRGSALKPTFW